MDSNSPLSVSLVTEADLAALADIQLAVWGRDTPDSRAAATRVLEQDMRENSGLKIVKAELPEGNTIGFSMLFFPNTNAATDEEKKPTTLRQTHEPGGSYPVNMDEYFWLEGSEKVERAAIINQYSREEIQKHVLGRDCAYVKNMCVLPGYQGRGVGRAIMAWACQRLDEQNIDAYLEASGAAERFYKACGFRIIGRSDMEFADGFKVGYSHMWRDAHAEGPSLRT